MAQTTQEKDPVAATKKTDAGPPRHGGPPPPPGTHVPFSSCQLEDSFTWKRIAASSGVHVVLLLIGASVPIVYTTNLDPPSRHLRIDFVVEEPLEEPEPPPRARPTPPPPRARPDPVVRITKPKPKPEPELIIPAAPEPPPHEAKRDEPEIVVPPRPVSRPEPPVRKVVSAEFDRPEPERPTRRAALEPPVRTDVFSEGSSAEPTTSLPARKVQTGGFGSPEGIEATKTTRRPGAPPKLGAFNLPEGPGQGNGAGGASGVRGAVASAGFGNGVATDGGLPGRPTGGRGTVRQGGFSTATNPPAGPSARPKTRPVEPALVPIEIVSKPKPAYTAEARRLRLEGEVVLEVRFEATGQPRVLRVVKGLGYGLDEAAVRAAEQIQFKPARRDGHAVDYTATVRMVFQLA